MGVCVREEEFDRGFNDWWYARYKDDNIIYRVPDIRSEKVLFSAGAPPLWFLVPEVHLLCSAPFETSISPLPLLILPQTPAVATNMYQRK